MFQQKMSLILHFIECLNHFGYKIEKKPIFAAYSEIDDSFSLKIDYHKLMKDENYGGVFKESLKSKYFEMKNELASTKVDKLLDIIWEHIGIRIKGKTLYPFRSAIMNGFVNEQTVIYEGVIDEYCHHLMILSQGTISQTAKEHIEGEFWSGLILGHFIDCYENCSNSFEDKRMMKTLAAAIKVQVDQKINNAGKK